MTKVFKENIPWDVDERKEYWVCELWNSSTKHPDEKYILDCWEDKSNLFDDEHQIFQWLLWIRSKQLWSFHAKEIVDYAIENWWYKEGK